MMRSCLSCSLVVAATAIVFVQGSTKQVIKSGFVGNLPFSAAVKAGGFVYVSGTVATNSAGEIVKGDIKAQTRQVLDNIAATLKAAGSALPYVASVTVYLRSVNDFAA